MKRFTLLMLLTSASVTALGGSYTAALSNQEDVRQGGNTGLNSEVFVAECKADAGYAEYSIGEWNSSSFGIGAPVSSIHSLTLNVAQYNSSWGLDGSFGIYLLTDTTTPLPNYSYNLASAGPQGFGTDISGNLQLLATEQYTRNSSPALQQDSYTISSLTSGQQAYLANQFNSGGNIRLVIAAEDNSVATSFYGVVWGPPTLTVSANATPEPAGVLILAPAALYLIRRKRV